jgi:serine phosphatase RsbU (regulator of sigma subunit)
VSEAISPEGEQFGTRRIEDGLHRRATESAKQILEGLVADVLEFTGEHGADDDLTVIVLKAMGDPAA